MACRCKINPGFVGLNTFTFLPYLGARLVSKFKYLMRRAGFKGHPFDSTQVRLILRHIIHLDFNEIKNAVKLVNQPVLCIWTVDDSLIEEQISQELSSALNATPVTLSSGGHNPQKFLAYEVASHIAEWLKTQNLKSRLIDWEFVTG